MISFLTTSRTKRAALNPLFCLTMPICLMLSGCVDRVATKSLSVKEDYREQHPLVLANAPQSLDLFTEGNGLTSASLARVEELGKNYRQNGQGPVVLLLPAGTNKAINQKAVTQIRSSLRTSGANTGIKVGTYTVADPTIAAPIRITYQELTAKLAHPCGQWPDDLGGYTFEEYMANSPYYNYGCSAQATLAAQVANPRDLASPQAETPPDTQMRIRAFQSVRQGNDPGTNWRLTNTNIGNLSSN